MTNMEDLTYQNYRKAARLINIGGWLFCLLLVFVMQFVVVAAAFLGYVNRETNIILLLAVAVAVLFVAIWSHVKAYRLLREEDYGGKIIGIRIGILYLVIFPIGTILGALIIHYLTTANEEQ